MEIAIKKKAIELRNEWGFGSNDPIRLKSLIIKLNIITLFKKLSDNFSGMSLKAGDNIFMLINSNHSLGRQHFTICHELYHLFVEKDFKPHQCHTGLFIKGRKNEYLADLFASYFLIPEDGIIKLLPDNEMKKDKITISTILRLEQYFSCSRKALLFRLNDLNLITKIKFEEYLKNIRATAKTYGYSTSLYEQGNNNLFIGDYGVLAKNLFIKNKISEGHYYSLMQDIGIDLLNNNEKSDPD